MKIRMTYGIFRAEAYLTQAAIDELIRLILAGTIALGTTLNQEWTEQMKREHLSLDSKNWRLLVGTGDDADSYIYFNKDYPAFIWDDWNVEYHVDLDRTLREWPDWDPRKLYGLESGLEAVSLQCDLWVDERFVMGRLIRTHGDTWFWYGCAITKYSSESTYWEDYEGPSNDLIRWSTDHRGLFRDYKETKWGGERVEAGPARYWRESANDCILYTMADSCLSFYMSSNKWYYWSRALTEPIPQQMLMALSQVRPFVEAQEILGAERRWYDGVVWPEAAAIDKLMGYCSRNNHGDTSTLRALLESRHSLRVGTVRAMLNVVLVEEGTVEAECAQLLVKLAAAEAVGVAAAASALVAAAAAAAAAPPRTQRPEFVIEIRASETRTMRATYSAEYSGTAEISFNTERITELLGENDNDIDDVLNVLIAEAGEDVSNDQPDMDESDGSRDYHDEDCTDSEEFETEIVGRRSALESALQSFCDTHDLWVPEDEVDNN